MESQLWARGQVTDTALRLIVRHPDAGEFIVLRAAKHNAFRAPQKPSVHLLGCYRTSDVGTQSV
jgi:hypothetical protein